MSTDAALIVVLVIVALASAGHRRIGWLAAVSAAVSFDLFLAPPHLSLTISRSADALTAVLLLIVGVCVTELAAWGRRQQARASRAEGPPSGIDSAAGSTTEGRSPSALVAEVSVELVRMFELSHCSFDYGCGVLGGNRPRLRHDGQIECQAQVWSDGHDGLPVGRPIELLVISPAGYRGRFLLVATAQSRGTLAQRRAAVALADQVAAVLRPTAV